MESTQPIEQRYLGQVKSSIDAGTQSKNQAEFDFPIGRKLLPKMLQELRIARERIQIVENMPRMRVSIPENLRYAYPPNARAIDFVAMDAMIGRLEQMAGQPTLSYFDFWHLVADYSEACQAGLNERRGGAAEIKRRLRIFFDTLPIVQLVPMFQKLTQFDFVAHRPMPAYLVEVTCERRIYDGTPGPPVDWIMHDLDHAKTALRNDLDWLLNPALEGGLLDSSLDAKQMENFRTRFNLDDAENLGRFLSRQGVTADPTLRLLQKNIRSRFEVYETIRQQVTHDLDPATGWNEAWLERAFQAFHESGKTLGPESEFHKIMRKTVE